MKYCQMCCDPGSWWKAAGEKRPDGEALFTPASWAIPSLVRHIPAGITGGDPESVALNQQPH